MAARRGNGPGTHASSASADRKRQRLALAAISGLVVAAIGLWAVAIATSGDRDALEIAAEPPAARESSPDAEEADAEEAGAEEADAEEAEDGDADAADAEAQDPAGDGGNGGDGEGGGDRDEDERVEQVRVTIDGVCDVELPVSDRDAGPLRAWDYPDCDYAPVPVEERRERWIVVRASMRDGDFDARAAERRAVELEVDGGVLWSSHYPSLNPDLWVVFDGPFPDARAARVAADAVVGEAYARELSTDDGDRYCIAADGCTGERAD